MTPAERLRRDVDWMVEVARSDATDQESDYEDGRADAEAEGARKLSAMRQRALRYAYHLHAERAVAWSIIQGALARHHMQIHRRAMGRIDRLVLGLPAFKVTT